MREEFYDDKTMYYMQDIMLNNIDEARAEFADVLADMKKDDRDSIRR